MIDIKGIKTGYGNQIVTDGLVLHLDAANPQSYDGNSNIWRDLSNLKRHFTLTNSPTFESVNRGSVKFDGINDYCVRISDSESTYTQISIFCWFKHNVTFNAEKHIIRKDGFYQLGFMNNNLIRNLVSGAGWTSSNDINYSFTLNKWYYFGFTCSGNSMKTYVDSNLVADKFLSSFSIAGNSNISYIAGLGGPGYLNGNIGIITMYNKSLSQQEILQNYNATKNRFI